MGKVKKIEKFKSTKSGPVCDLKNKVGKGVKNNLKYLNKFTQKLTDFSDLKSKTDKLKKKYEKKLDKASQKAEKGFISKIKEEWKTRYGVKISRRPDLVFLLDILIAIVFGVILYNTIFNVKDLIAKFFTNRKLFKNLGKVPLNQLDPETFRKEKLKLEASRAHTIYYKLKPFGEFSEDDKMQKTNR